MKIAIIYVLLFFLSPFSYNFLGRRMFDEKFRWNAKQEFMPGNTRAFLVRLTAVLCHFLNGPTLRVGGGFGGLKVSVEMTLSED